MLKKILISFSALVVLFIVLPTIFLNWLNNPLGLEPERLGPKGDEKIPSISSVPNRKNYLLYLRHKDNNFVIHLPLPNEYLHPSRATTRIIKTYSASATMYYPELNGKFHPKNSNLPKCTGWCNDQVRAFITPYKSSALTKNTRELERIQKQKLRDSHLYYFEDLDSEFDLDDHFQIRYPVLEEKYNGKYSTKEYFLKWDQNGEVQYLFSCAPYAHSPACSVKFNLSSRPELLVDIRFSRHLMENWQDIIGLVNKKITSWGLVRIEAVLE